MLRNLVLVVATILVLFGAIASGTRAADVPCRPAYVVPYSEQCDFAHASIKKDGSVKNVSNAFATCDRAQDEAGNCLSSPVKQVHVIALSALYRSISEQADISMFAGQYKTAAALLHEELNVLDIAQREAKPGDQSLAQERSRAKADLASTASGECSERAYGLSAPARAFARDRRYKDLEKTLVTESSAYTQCAKIATTPQKKAYIEYISLVAVEEAGRASQAAGDPDDAKKLFRLCGAGTSRSERYADTATKKYLIVLATLCQGRADGTYKPDEPRPLDQEGGAFRPLALPKR